MRFLQLADPQFGMSAHMSGRSAEEIADYASRGMIVRAVPKFEGLEPDTRSFGRAIEVANGLRPEFVVVCGDMMNDCRNTGQRDEVLRVAGGLDPSVPIYWVPGNHDVCDDTVAPNPEALARYRRDWGDDYYAFQHGDVSFVVLDSSVFYAPEQVEGELDSQMRFLDAELRAARRRESSHTIVFTHHPFFLQGPDEPDQYFNVPLERRIPALELMGEHEVSAVFAGHLHQNSYASGDSLEMVTTGAVGYTLGKDPEGYRVVDLTDAGIEHRYYALWDDPE